MQRILFFIAFVIAAAPALAQINTLGDSLGGTGVFGFEHKNLRGGYRNVADSMYVYEQANRTVAFLQTGITQLRSDTNTRFGSLQLLYAGSQNGFRLPTETYSRRDVLFATDGIADLGRAKLYGRFQFTKSWEDSLANNLTTGVEDFAPYQYFTPKAGTYERQSYRFAAGGSFRISKKWYAGTNMLYDYYWVTGSVDPRVEAGFFRIKLTPEITYQPDENTLIGVNATFGKGDENFNIDYKSQVFNLSQLYPERFFYLNYGYGYIGLKDRSLDRRSYDYKGAGASFYQKFMAADLRFNLAYSQDFSTNFLPKAKGNPPLALSTFLLNSLSADVLWNRFAWRGRSQLALHGIYMDGSDENYTMNAKNYFYQRAGVGATYLYLVKGNKKFEPEFGINAQYNQYKKQDMAQATHLQSSAAEVGVLLNGYWHVQKDQFIARLRPSLKMPVNNSLFVPATQQNVFTQRIADAEYYFNGYSVFSTGVTLHYLSSSLFKGLHAGVIAKALYEQQLGNSSQAVPAHAFTGGRRLHFELGINVLL